MNSSDVESLEPSGRSRSRCLDTCLLVSVITLFVLVLGGGAAALVLLTNPRGDTAAPQSSRYRASPEHGDVIPETLDYKGQNFAYLRATSGNVRDGVMKWESVKYGRGETVGSRYRFDPDHSSLRVVQEGSYFLYTQLNFTCNHLCNKTTVKVTFEDQQPNTHLSCTVELPNGYKSVAKTCWSVVPHLEKDSRLLAKVHVPKSSHKWKLDVNSSGFGMFLVDGPFLGK